MNDRRARRCQPARPTSVLIAAYQAEWCLDACLASIAYGSHLPERVIVVDDGSTEATSEVAEGWSSRLPMTVVRLPTNVGLAAARNAGLAVADTELISVLDADDMVLPDHIRMSVDAHEAFGGIISPNAFYWLGDGRLTSYRNRLRRTSVPKTDQLAELLRRNFVFVASTVARQRLRDFVGFRGMPSTPPQDGAAIPPIGARGIVEDWDMWLRLVADGEQVSALRTPTVLYRVTRESLGSSERSLANAALHLLQVFEHEHPGLATSAVRRGRRELHARLRVSDLQEKCRGLERRATPAETLRSLSCDPRLVSRTLGMALLPPSFVNRHFGQRGAW